MQRFFFHVLNQTSYVRDEFGSDLATLDSARDQASDAAGEILTSDLRDGRTDVKFEVQVEDTAGARLLTVRIAAAIETGVSGAVLAAIRDSGADSAG